MLAVTEQDRFTRWFRGELERRQLTQESAAREIDVPLAAVSRWATGRTLPSYEMLVKIKKAWSELPPPLG